MSHTTRPLNDEELLVIVDAVETVFHIRCTIGHARRIADELDLEVEVDHYGPEVGYSASRWITSWSKDQ